MARVVKRNCCQRGWMPMSWTQFQMESALYMLDWWEQLLAVSVFVLLCAAFNYYTYYWFFVPFSDEYLEPRVLPQLRAMAAQWIAVVSGSPTAAAAAAGAASASATAR